MISNHPAPQEFGKVAVLMGGNSAERDVSLASGQAILNALHEYGIDAHCFDPKHRSICELVDEGFARAFIALHGRGGEDGSIQGALEQLSIPYTGSGITGSALSIDKILSKLIWSAHKLPTADFVVVKRASYRPEQCPDILRTLGGTVMVKPALEGSSLGIAKASDDSSLRQAIEEAFTYDNSLLIERFINGPEYTVGILADQALPSISMRAASGFYDYHAKYQATTTEYDCPSGLEDAQEKYLRSLSLQAFNALQCSGWGRIDVMLDTSLNKQTGEANEQFYLLECNTVPGMTNTSLVPKAAQQQGIDFVDLVVTILAQTINATSKEAKD